jgi:voltage-gated sodium channel
LRFVVEALLHAIPGIASIGILMLIIFYVFAVMATGLYGQGFPEWFGSLGSAMFTLFQIMTLESWSMGVVRPVMLEHPYAWIFFVLFILVATFTMLNLFIGVIVDTMQIMHARERERAAPATSIVADAEPGELTREIRALRVEVAQLQEAVAKSSR